MSAELSPDDVTRAQALVRVTNDFLQRKPEDGGIQTEQYRVFEQGHASYYGRVARALYRQLEETP